MKRHELTDEQWAAIEALVPNDKARTGRPDRGEGDQSPGGLGDEGVSGGVSGEIT